MGAEVTLGHADGANFRLEANSSKLCADNFSPKPHAEGSFFSPSESSLGHIQFIADRLPILQKDIPQVRGIGFFGSRIVGTERTNPDTPSDLDTIVFYDGTEFEVDESTFEIVGVDGQLLPDAGKRMRELADKRRASDKARSAVTSRIRHTIFDLMSVRGLPIDVDEETGKGKTVFLIDISKDETDNSLRVLQLYVDANTDHSTGKVTPDGINGPIFPLVSRFLPAIGEGIQQNRGYVLDQLEMNEVAGERHFRGLIDCLSGVGRDSFPMTKLPQNVTDARAYFGTNTT